MHAHLTAEKSHHYREKSQAVTIVDLVFQIGLICTHQSNARKKQQQESLNFVGSHSPGEAVGTHGAKPAAEVGSASS
jgi:hypothetical protein